MCMDQEVGFDSVARCLASAESTACVGTPPRPRRDQAG